METETIIKENNELAEETTEQNVAAAVAVPVEQEVVPEQIESEEVEEVEDEEVAEELDCDVDDCDEIDEENLGDSKVTISAGGEWVNEDQVPVTKIKVVVPRKLLNAIRDIETCVNKKFHGKPEFSIYIHGDYDEHGNLVVGEDFYIPKQEVGGASVDYKEAPDEYYNGCMHKHPDGCKSFSGTDKRYINSNFEFSLLYVCGKLHTGIVNVRFAKNSRVQVGVDIDIQDDETVGINIDNIKEPERKVVTGFSVSPGKQFCHKTPPLLPGFTVDDPKTTRGEIILPHCMRDDGEEDIEEVESENELSFDFMSQDPEKVERAAERELDFHGLFDGGL